MSEALERLAREVSDLVGEVPDELVRAQRARLLAAPSRRWRARWFVLPALAAAAGAGLLAWRAELRPQGSPTTRAAPPPAAPLEEDRWLRAPADADLPPLAIGDGSEVRVRRGARGRLSRPDRRRVRVTVESGRMDVSVNPDAGKSWLVHAGAYRVSVLGTVFFVEHRPSDEVVEVGVARGRVAISGGKLGGETLTLGAGSRFRVEGASIDVIPAEEPAAAADGPAPARKARPSWQALYKSGQYAQAVAEAERVGWARILATGRAPDVAALADAARLAGEAERARTALTTLRRRFPDTVEAATAAFLLGRMDADRATDFSSAARWLEQSLREQPRGPYAREALGRLMVVYRRSGDAARARATAETYLQRHPDGPYADLARTLAPAVARP